MSSEVERSPSVFFRLFVVSLILSAGVGGFVVLKMLKQPPQLKPVTERALAVEAITAQPTDRQVVLGGFGEITATTTVVLSSEVAGRVVSTHGQLEAGRTIVKGTVLINLDQKDFQLDYETALSRLQILKGDLVLAENELKRLTQLYRKNKVGTLPSLEQAEAAVNSIANQIRQVEKDRDLAGLRRERCVVRAPFDCRIIEVSVEKDEYVTAGKQLVTLVDDSALEVLVALDSREAASWLELQAKKSGGPVNWFGQPKKVSCQITWTENETLTGKGWLDRIVRFDKQTRTLVVAVRLQPESSAPFPLTEGMFCKVEVPGKTLEGVYILPRQAVTHEHTVYTVVKDRLRTSPVTVLRMEGHNAYISAGLNQGDTVIITRLEDPLEHSLVKVSISGKNP